MTLFRFNLCFIVSRIWTKNQMHTHTHIFVFEKTAYSCAVDWKAINKYLNLIKKHEQMKYCASRCVLRSSHYCQNIVVIFLLRSHLYLQDRRKFNQQVSLLVLNARVRYSSNTKKNRYTAHKVSCINANFIHVIRSARFKFFHLCNSLYRCNLME